MSHYAKICLYKSATFIWFWNYYTIVKLCGQNCDIVQFQQHLLVTSGRKFIWPQWHPAIKLVLSSRDSFSLLSVDTFSEQENLASCGQIKSCLPLAVQFLCPTDYTWRTSRKYYWRHTNKLSRLASRDSFFDPFDYLANKKKWQHMVKLNHLASCDSLSVLYTYWPPSQWRSQTTEPGGLIHP
jgi:hypothetical protein